MTDDRTTAEVFGKRTRDGIDVSRYRKGARSKSIHPNGRSIRRPWTQRDKEDTAP